MTSTHLKPLLSPPSPPLSFWEVCLYYCYYRYDDYSSLFLDQFLHAWQCIIFFLLWHKCGFLFLETASWDSKVKRVRVQEVDCVNGVPQIAAWDQRQKKERKQQHTCMTYRRKSSNLPVALKSSIAFWLFMLHCRWVFLSQDDFYSTISVPTVYCAKRQTGAACLKVI